MVVPSPRASGEHIPIVRALRAQGTASVPRFFFLSRLHQSRGEAEGSARTARMERATFLSCALCEHTGQTSRLTPSSSSSRLSLCRRHFPYFHDLLESPQVLGNLLPGPLSEQLRDGRAKCAP